MMPETDEDGSEPSYSVCSNSSSKSDVPTTLFNQTPANDASRHEDLVRRVYRNLKTNNGSFKDEVPTCLPYEVKKTSRRWRLDR